MKQGFKDICQAREVPNLKILPNLQQIVCHQFLKQLAFFQSDQLSFYRNNSFLYSSTCMYTFYSVLSTGIDLRIYLLLGRVGSLGLHPQTIHSHLIEKGNLSPIFSIKFP